MRKHPLSNEQIHLLGDVEQTLEIDSLMPVVEEILHRIEDACEAYMHVAYLLVIRLQHRASEAQLSNGRGELKQRIYQLFTGEQYSNFETFEDEVLFATGNYHADNIKRKFEGL